MPITQESHRVAKFKTKQNRELDAAIRDITNIIDLANTNEAAIAAIPAGDGVKRKALFINQAPIPQIPERDPALVDFDNTGYVWEFTYVAPGTFTLRTASGATVDKIFVNVGNNNDAVLKVDSIVDSFGTIDITISKYMLDGSPAVDGLTTVSLEVLIMP